MSQDPFFSEKYIYFIIGGPGSGKTTVAKTITKRNIFDNYNFRIDFRTQNKMINALYSARHNQRKIAVCMHRKPTNKHYDIIQNPFVVLVYVGIFEEYKEDLKHFIRNKDLINGYQKLFNYAAQMGVKRPALYITKDTRSGQIMAEIRYFFVRSQND